MNVKLYLRLAIFWFLFLGVGCAHSEQNLKEKNKNAIVNPYSNYNFLIEMITQNRDAIISGSPFVNMLEKPYCEAIIDDLIIGKMKPIEPNYIAQTEQDLEEFLGREYGCRNFSHAPIDITAGNHRWSFYQEAPFLIYQLQHQGQAYFSLLGSGATKNKERPKTPELDYEFDTWPKFLIYSGKNCSYKGGATIKGGENERGINVFSGFLSGQDGIAYSYTANLYQEINRGSIGIHPLFPTKKNRCSSTFVIKKEN